MFWSVRLFPAFVFVAVLVLSPVTHADPATSGLDPALNNRHVVDRWFDEEADESTRASQDANNLASLQDLKEAHDRTVGFAKSADQAPAEGSTSRHVVDRWFETGDPSTAIYAEATGSPSLWAPAAPEPDTKHADD